MTISISAENDIQPSSKKLQAIITPGKLSGRIAAIPSKSYAHRILLAAALSTSPTQIVCPHPSEDIQITAEALRSLGATIASDQLSFSVSSPIHTSNASAFCGACGTTLRFLLPVACALGITCRFTGAGLLLKRPLSPLKEELEAHGVSLSQDEYGIYCSGQLHCGAYTIRGDVSSQFVSGLLFALPLLNGDSSLTLTGTVESLPYIRMTLDVLEQFSIDITCSDDLRCYTIRGGQRFSSPENITVEGDWSNAAFWLTAGALSAPITVDGLNPQSLQGDRQYIDILTAMNATIAVEGHAVTVSPSPEQSCNVDASQIPDLIPTLAVTASAISGKTQIVNAGRLRLKESDRIETIVRMLRNLGGEIDVFNDTLQINGCGSLRGGWVDGANDHRIVMAAAIASILCRDTVVITDAQAAAKSYPRFFADFAALGGQVLLQSIEINKKETSQ